ncbi:hypothetical protein MASR2M52_19950 [Pedobacter sp.]
MQLALKSKLAATDSGKINKKTVKRKDGFKGIKFISAMLTKAQLYNAIL